MTLRSGSAERHENMDSGSGTVTVDDTVFQELIPGWGRRPVSGRRISELVP
jgi:hypothetical protein